METQLIYVSVGICSPVNDDLIFNIHFNKKNFLSWIIQLSYSQISSIDNFVSSNSSKINQVMFPNLSSVEIRKIIQFLQKQINNPQDCLDRCLFENKNAKLTKKILSTTKLIENWIHTILFRLHVMPKNVIHEILMLTKLPNGPFSDEELLNFGIYENAKSIPSTDNGSNINSRKDYFANIINLEQTAENLHPPLLRISVSRSNIVQRGKVQYKISIQHSRNTRTTPPSVYEVYKLFADFEELNSNVDFISDGGGYDECYFMEFPVITEKSMMLGVNTTEESESDHSSRTRCLDTWLRDLCSHFALLKTVSQIKLLEFLNLKTSLNPDSQLQHEGGGGVVQQNNRTAVVDIKKSITERLIKGLIECTRADLGRHNSAFLFEQSSTSTTAPPTTVFYKYNILNAVVTGENPFIFSYEEPAVAASAKKSTNKLSTALNEDFESQFSFLNLEGEIEPGDVFNWYSDIRHDIEDNKNNSVLFKFINYDALLFSAKSEL